MQGIHHLEILIHCVNVVTASVVAGAARSASTQPVVWEIGGALLVFMSGLMIGFELDKERYNTVNMIRTQQSYLSDLQ